MKGKVTEEKELREWLWLNHGHSAGLYGDDVEMQCHGVDFKRMDIKDIIRCSFIALSDELAKQQKINNLVLADKCDELDKIVAKFEKRIEPIRMMYARWEHLDEPMSVKVKKTDIRFEILNDLWQAIKQVMEVKDEKEN